MRLKQALTNKNDQNKLKAIVAHAKFINFILGEVNRHGLDVVLELKNDAKLWWLNKAYHRIIDFAEEYQLRSIPQKLEGAGEDGEIIIKVIKENSHGDHLQAPRFAVPNIQ